MLKSKVKSCIHISEFNSGNIPETTYNETIGLVYFFVGRIIMLEKNRYEMFPFPFCESNQQGDPGEQIEWNREKPESDKDQWNNNIVFNDPDFFEIEFEIDTETDH